MGIEFSFLASGVLSLGFKFLMQGMSGGIPASSFEPCHMSSGTFSD